MENCILENQNYVLGSKNIVPSKHQYQEQERNQMKEMLTRTHVEIA